MAKFIQAGTKLRCVDDKDSATFIDETTIVELEKGKVYTVKHDSSDGFVAVEGIPNFLYTIERFEEAVAEPKHQLVYLSAPYSKYENRHALMTAIMTISGLHMVRNPGQHVVSPLFNHYSMANVPGMGSDYNFWGDYSRNLLKRCDKIIVVKFPGWEESVGVKDEIRFAQELGIELEFVELSQFNYNNAVFETMLKM